MPRAATTRPRLPRGARDRAFAVVELLREEYPVAECALVHDTPMELLVATILSAQSTDERVNIVTPELFRRYPTPRALATAPLPEVEEVIHSTGFFRAKSRAIVEMAQDVVERFGGEVPPRMEDLVTLRGVGRKTANVVLGVAFGLPGFAVDTHVTRLTARLRLTSSTDPVRIEQDVCSVVPPAEWSDLSLRLIQHGRRVCEARRPRCHACVLAGVCPSVGMGTAPRKAPRRGGGAGGGRGGTRGAGATAVGRARRPTAGGPARKNAGGG